eukprot:3339097-Amphidinium_carterae.1
MAEGLTLPAQDMRFAQVLASEVTVLPMFTCASKQCGTSVDYLNCHASTDIVNLNGCKSSLVLPLILFLAQSTSYRQDDDQCNEPD